MFSLGYCPLSKLNICVISIHNFLCHVGRKPDAQGLSSVLGQFLSSDWLSDFMWIPVFVAYEIAFDLACTLKSICVCCL